jgi:hypothetical protein
MFNRVNQRPPTHFTVNARCHAQAMLDNFFSTLNHHLSVIFPRRFPLVYLFCCFGCRFLSICPIPPIPCESDCSLYGVRTICLILLLLSLLTSVSWHKIVIILIFIILMVFALLACTHFSELVLIIGHLFHSPFFRRILYL